MTPVIPLLAALACAVVASRHAARAFGAQVIAEEPLLDWNRLSEFPYNPHFSDRELAVILDDIATL